MPGRERTKSARLAPLGLAACLVLGACSSGDGDPASPSKAELRRRNQVFLEDQANFMPDQAACVARQVSEDLAALLTKGSGDSDLTKKAGYEEFAAAVRLCVRQDTSLTTSTTGG